MLRKTTLAPLLVSLVLFTCAGIVAQPILQMIIVDKKTFQGLEKEIEIKQTLLNFTSTQIDTYERSIENMTRIVRELVRGRVLLEALARGLGIPTDLKGLDDQIRDYEYRISGLETQITGMRVDRGRLIREIDQLTQTLVWLRRREALTMILVASAVVSLAVFAVFVIRERRHTTTTVRP